MRLVWPRSSKQRREDLDEEITHDLKLDAEERIQSGMSRSAADRASRRDFGNVLLVREATRRAWESAVGQMLLPIVDDIARAFRRLIRCPTSRLGALAILTLATAANVTVFSFVDGVLLRPLALPHPDRIVVLSTVLPTGESTVASPAMYNYFRQQTHLVEDVTVVQSVLVKSTVGDASDATRAARVTANYFRLFGAKMSAGRTFSDEEDRSGGPSVAVVSHRLWVERFGQGEVIGRTIRINDQRHLVIGVISPTFRPGDLGGPPDVWLPLQLAPDSAVQAHFFSVCGRLKPGVTLDQARRSLAHPAEALRQARANAVPKGGVLGLRQLEDVLVGATRPVLFGVLGGVVFVWIVACASVSNLVLLETGRRGRDLAIRAAIGADRRRLFQEVFTEGIVVTTLGGLMGLALGWSATRPLLAAGLNQLPRLRGSETLTFDWRIATFAAVTSALAGVALGWVNGRRAACVDLGAAVAATRLVSATPTRKRLELILVSLQVSLAAMLLATAVLVVRAVATLTRVSPGFTADRILTLRTPLGGLGASDVQGTGTTVRRGIVALRDLPDVMAVGVSYGLPLERGFTLPFAVIERSPVAGHVQHGVASWRAVSPGYFDTLGIALTRGRGFLESDGPGGLPVGIVNDVFAREYWPREDPIGKRLILGRGMGPPFTQDPVREIVGVAAATRDATLERQARAGVYIPLAQLPAALNAFVAADVPLVWTVRPGPANGPSASTLQTHLQQAIDAPVTGVLTMNDVVRRSLFRQRLGMWFMVGFGGAALAIAVVGLYTLLADFVARHAREIAIRRALGAGDIGVARPVIRRSAGPAGIGAATGLATAMGLQTVTARWLLGSAASDYAAVGIALLMIGIIMSLAVWLPIQRALRIDPVVTLRRE